MKFQGCYFYRQQTLITYDKNGIMIVAKLPKSEEIRKEIENIFSNNKASYIQVHNTNLGCYNCQVNSV